MDRVEFAKAMAVLTSGLNIRMPDPQAEVYFDLLRDLPLPALQIAVKRVLLEHRISTIPTIAEIRALAVEAISPPEIDAAGALWLVREAVKRFGWAQPAEALRSLPRRTRRVVSAIGWRSICESDNPEALRAHFFRLYESATRHDLRDGLLPEGLRRSISESQRMAVGRVAKAIAVEEHDVTNSES